MTKTTILIAEDSDDDFFLLDRACLKAEINVRLMQAKDGEEAINYLAGQSQFADRATYPLPGLFLLDLKMPKLNGFDVLEWLRRQPGLRRLIVAVLTSSTAPTDINRAYALGANSYLAKPSSASGYVELAEKLRGYWLELNHPPGCAGKS